MASQTLLDKLFQNALDNAEGVFLMDETGATTWAAAADAVRGLAEDLTSAGVRSGSIILLEGDKCSLTFLVMLSLWHVQAVVVPTDPALQDSAKRKIASFANLGIRVTRNTSPGEEHFDITPYPDNAHAARVDDRLADGPSYIMTTSGTSGEPKLVVGSLSNLTALGEWQAKECGVGPSDRVAQLASLSFDATFKDLTLAIFSGASLVVPEEAPLLHPVRTLEWLERNGVTVVQTVPSVFRSWLSTPTRVELEKVRLITFAGEVLTGRAINAVRARWPQCRARIFNLYGLTEATVIQAAYLVPEDEVLPFGPLPIGVGIPGHEVRPLNKRGQECALGQTGEIVIQSRSGCLVTDRAHVLEALETWGSGQRREYRTGDQGRFTKPNEITIAGRNINHLKIRGVRVDPLQVSTAIAQAGDLQEVAVSSVILESGDPRLVAFAIPKPASQFDADCLLEHLKTVLRPQEVPDLIHGVSSLPITRNGKLDTQRLRARAADLLDNHVDSWDPRDKEESIVADLWAELVGHRRFTDNSDFFRIGGNSLSAVQCLAQVSSRYGIEISARSFFETPTLAFLAHHLRSDTPCTPLQQRGEAKGLREGAPPAPDAELLRPASRSQREIWMAQSIEPQSNAYLMYGELELPSHATPEIVRDALKQLAAHHSALRTRVELVGDVLQQRVLNEVASPEVFVGQEDDPWRARALAPLNPAIEVWRASFIQNSTSKSLLLVVHHIICDGWSWTVLTEDLLAILNGEHPKPARSFYEFADDAPCVIAETPGRELDATHPFTIAPELVDVEIETKVAGILQAQVSNELREAVAHTARKLKTTPFVVYFACFSFLAARQSKQDVLRVGTDFAGREADGSERAVGLFIRASAIKLELDLDCSVRDLIQQMHGTLLDSQTKTGDLKERVGRPFDLMFRTPASRRSADSGLLSRARVRTSSVTQAKFGMTWTVAFDDWSDHIEIEYRSDRYSPEFVQALSGRFEELGCAMLEQLERPLNEVVRESITPTSNLIQGMSPEAGPDVLEMIRHQAESNPSRVAIEHDEQAITYASLWKQLEDAANVLHAKYGSADEMPVVAISYARPYDNILAWLGALRAGVCPVFCPVDATTTWRENLETTAKPGGWLNDDTVPMRAMPAVTRSQTLPEFRRSDAPYIFFSSGSRGTPKAIVGRLDGLSNLIRWHIERVAQQPVRVGLTTDFSFDAVLRDIFTPLCSGGVLVVPSDREKVVGGGVLTFAQLHELTLLHAVPSVVSNLCWLSESGEKWPTSLKRLCMSGEPVARALISRVQSCAGQSELQIDNLYGATEATMIQSAYSVRASDPHPVLPVGDPADNVELYVIDNKFGVCTVGEIGEIIVRSPLAICSYLNPDATLAERFTFNPYRDDPRDRIFKTGDLGRVQSDGTIQVLGRADDQTKIRGVSVNLSNVQSAIERTEGVACAYVTVGSSIDGSSELVAYVQLLPTHDLDAVKRLSALLRERMPAAEVPSRILTVETIPLRPSGKVDEHALKQLASSSQEKMSTPESEQEQTQTESRIAEIWRAILDRQSIDLDESFFAIGGHSLLATLVMIRMRDTFRLEAPLRLIFEFPTIRTLAHEFDALLSADSGPSATEVFTRFTGEKNKTRLYAIHPIGGSASCYRDLALSMQQSVDLIGVSSPALVDDSPLVDDLRSLAFQYLELIADEEQSSDIHLLGWSFGGLLAYEIARLAPQFDLDVLSLTLLDTYAPGSRAYPPHDLASDFINRSLLGDFATIADGPHLARLQTLLQSPGSLSGDAPLSLLLEQFGDDNGITREDLIRRREIIAGHWSAAAKYEHRPLTSDVPLSFVHAANEPDRDFDATLGWESVLGYSVRKLSVPETHRGLIASRVVERIAAFALGSAAPV